MLHPRPLTTAAIAAVGAVTVAAIPTGPVPSSASNLFAWWEAVGTASATISVARCAIAATFGWIALVASLYAAGDALRLPALRTAALRLATPSLRRHLTVGVLAISLTGTGLAAAQDAPISLTDVGLAEVDAGPNPEPQGSDLLLTDIGAVDDAAELDVRHPLAASRGRGWASVTTVEVRDAWLVETGDHLWAIAEATVLAADPSADEHEVTDYWARVIAANRAALAGDPDLIHPGQVISLPPLG